MFIFFTISIGISGTIGPLINGGGKMTKRSVAILSVVIAVAGCDKTNWESSIFRAVGQENDEPKYLVTDAKQRVIVNASNFRSEEKNRHAKRIICAEPSPDVSQALSEAVKFAAEVNVAGKGSGSIGLDRSFAQSVAQLGERLAVIQLLRDKMYRACEAYANGAVKASGYTLMLARLDKTMVSLLSSEMAAGAFGRNLAQLGGSASQGGVPPKELEAAKEKINTAVEGLKTAEEGKEEEAEKELNAALIEYYALERANAAQIVNASVSSNAIGTIPGDRANSGSTIAAIHQNYLDDHGLEPLIDACVVAMDSTRTDEGIVTAIDALNNKLTNLISKKNDREEAKETLSSMVSEDNPQKLSDVFAKLPKNQKSQISETLGLSHGSITDEEINASIEQTNKDVASIRQRIAELLTSRNSFAAFCQANVLTTGKGKDSLIVHMTNLKRDLRGSRITNEGVVKAQPVIQTDKALEDFYIAQGEKRAATKKCEGLRDFMMANPAKTDKDGKVTLPKLHVDAMKAFNEMKCRNTLGISQG